MVFMNGSIATLSLVLASTLSPENNQQRYDEQAKDKPSVQQIVEVNENMRARVEKRKERREVRQENRQNRREARQENRTERQENRQN